MHYEINIRLHGQHFFAIAERSITDSIKLLKVYTALQKAFPKTNGYEIIVTKYPSSGVIIDIDKMQAGISQND